MYTYIPILKPTNDIFALLLELCGPITFCPVYSHDPRAEYSSYTYTPLEAEGWVICLSPHNHLGRR